MTEPKPYSPELRDLLLALKRLRLELERLQAERETDRG